MTWLRRYNLPSERGEGWAIIVLGSDGFFAAVSDFGNYAFRWGCPGVADFRKFMLDPEPSYMLSKLSRRDVWDGEATARGVRQHIIKMRREGDMDAARAREEFDLVKQHEGLDSREAFALWYQETDIADAHEFAVVSYPGDAHAFVTKTLVRLAAVLRAELEAELGMEGATT